MCLLLPLTAHAAPLYPLPITEIDRIVAVVNDSVIVASELNERIRTSLNELRESGVRTSTDILREQLLERLVLDLLQVQAAERAGILIDEQRLNNTIAGIAKRNGLSFIQFRQVLERDGYDFAAFQKNIRHQLMITEIQKRRVVNRIQITDREVDNYLSMQSGGNGTGKVYRLAHILIAVEDNPSPNQVRTARRKADEVIRKLRAGSDFSRMAIFVSDGKQALDGGDLGWRGRDKLPTLFADIIPGMTPGQISKPLLDSSGFHIVKLVDISGQGSHMVTQTRARHILIRTNEITSDADAKTRLGQIRERIVQGESFEELAKSHSDDRGTAIKGGELGWLSAGDVVPLFAEAMDRLAPMELSGPFRTQFGWHIVQVLEKREHDSTDDVRRAEARQEIRERKIDEELQAWLRQLREEAYVEYRLEE